MKRGVIRLGDPTGHGGRVLAASGAPCTVDGIPVARIGDACYCPRKGHGGCVIAEGDPQFTVGGVPVAFEGHRTSCGALLHSTAPHLERD